MEPLDGAQFFSKAPDAYNAYMGRFSLPLAHEFVERLPLEPGQSFLNVGCGPGALTGVLVEKFGAGSVSVIDPSPPFLQACLAAWPGITGKQGVAESIPFPDRVFDVTLAQLVLVFVPDTARAGEEMRRVTRSGGVIAVNSWDLERMELMAPFWKAAGTVTGAALQGDAAVRYTGKGDLTALFTSFGLEDVEESEISVQAEFESFEELWAGYSYGIGTVGAWFVDQTVAVQLAVKQQLFADLGKPDGPIRLSAVARYAVGRNP